MSLDRSRKAVVTLLAAAGIGSAAAQTGTITFLGAIVSPSCGFRPTAGLVNASCQQPSGQTISAPFAVAPGRLNGPTRIGVAALDVAPAHAGQRGPAPAYLVTVTYH